MGAGVYIVDEMGLRSEHHNGCRFHQARGGFLSAVLGSEGLLECLAEILEFILTQSVNHAGVLAGYLQQVDPLQDLDMLGNGGLGQGHSFHQFSTAQTVGMLHKLGDNRNPGRMSEPLGKLCQSDCVSGKEIRFVECHYRIIAIRVGVVK